MKDLTFENWFHACTEMMHETDEMPIKVIVGKKMYRAIFYGNGSYEVI